MSDNRQDACSTKQRKVRSILVLFERTFAMRQGLKTPVGMGELTNNTGTAFDVQLRRLELVNKVCLTSKSFMLQ